MSNPSMVVTRGALAKLSYEELMNYAEQLGPKQDVIIEKLEIVQDELKSINDRFIKLEAELAVSKTVNEALKNHVRELNHRVVSTERKMYANEQYSRSECIEISGIPPSVVHNQTRKNNTRSF